MASTSCGIYTRISDDAEGFGLGVARQLKDCTALANRRGWTIVAEYRDNDVSATRKKARLEYQRMLGDVRAGRVTTIVVWDADRLTRQPREAEDILDLVEKHGLELASVGGEFDLSTPQGRMMLRMKVTIAKHETEQSSRRIKRRFLQAAQDGQPHGMVAYGYRRTDSGDVLDEDQAAVIRTAARLLLGGQSLRSVAAQLNADGLTSPRSGRWDSATVRQVMLRDRNAGLRRHQGKVIGPAAWQPIYCQGTHDQVVAMLTNPGRRTNKGATRKHLLTGIARCSRPGCDGTMVVNNGRVSAAGKHQPPAYVCKKCTKIRRKQKSVDDVVEAAVIERLSDPDALADMAFGDQEAARAALAEEDRLQAKLDRYTDQAANDEIGPEQLARLSATLRPRIAAARATVVAQVPVPGLADLIGDDAPARWAAASLDTKRLVIEALLTVTILPSGAGRSFDPDLIRLAWKV